MGVLGVLSGCRFFQPSVMFRTGPGYQYDEFIDSTLSLYRIDVNDRLNFRLYTNDGFKLIEMTATGLGVSGGSGFGGNNLGMSYLVEYDGTVKLPILGRTPVSGMTVRETELLLESEYSKFYNKPFAILEVPNTRVIMFPGSGGSAKVLSLVNQQTTLLEALASAGGISSGGKANKVKIIRGDLQDPSVFLIDLSTIDGMKKADMVLQANDIIYVEPQFRLASEVLSEITPVLALISSIFTISATIILLKPN